MRFDLSLVRASFLSRSTALLSFGLLISSGVANSHDIGQSEVRQLVRQGTIQPLLQIMNQSPLQDAGRILEIELENEDGLYIYAIDTLDDQGIVREYKLNAHDGSLLHMELED